MANCNYAVSPTAVLTAATASENNTFGIATAIGCAWTATANANWVNITGGAASNGNGTVTYSLQANPSNTNARLGTITAGGQTFTIRQPAANQPCLPVGGGLLNWYRGEGHLLDSIGANDANGNNDYIQDGRIGQAFNFNGASSVSVERRIAENFTIEFWLRTPSAGGGSETDWAQGAGLVANDDFGVSLGNGKILFGVGNTTLASANTINDNQWHHVAATRNRTSGIMRLYIDGNLEPNTATGGTQILNGAAQLIFGRRGTNGAFYTGGLDEVKIFENELDDNQATASFNGCGNALPRLAINNRTVPEGDPNPNGELDRVAFTVNLSSPVDFDVAVNYTTKADTAIEGVDFVGSSGTVYIPAGQTSATIFVPIISNDNAEPDRSFEVILFDSLNASIDDDEGIGTIIDDDAPCDFSLGAAGANLSATASNGNIFSVSGQSGCVWTASGSDNWITVANGSTANGTGTVTYSVAANAGLARSGFIIVAGKIFQINQAASPNATAFITGRIFTGNGRAVSKALVTLTNEAGDIFYSPANPFGYYRFDNVRAGQTVTVSVRSKQFVFLPQTVNVNTNYGDLNFFASSQ